MASSGQKHHQLSSSCGASTAPPPTPSTQTNLLSTYDAADALSSLLNRLPPTLSLSLPSLRPSPSPSTTTATSAPIISLSDPKPTVHSNLLSASQLGFFQLTKHSVSSQLAQSAESELLSLFKLPHDQKQLLFPKNWPFGFDADDDDDENTFGESLCLGSFLPVESIELSLTSLREFTEEMEKVALEVVEALSHAVGFDSPVRVDPSKICTLMWISEESIGDKTVVAGRFYPYILGLRYQIRSQKYLMFADSGWVSVSPQVDSVLVTLGDIAQVWSNGKLKKVRGRRAISSGDTDTNLSQCISMKLLLTLPLDSTVAPLVPGMPIADVDHNEINKEEDAMTEIAEEKEKWIFNSFSFEDYAWRVYNERLSLKDPLNRYRV